MGKKNRRNKNNAATSGDDMSDVSSLRTREGVNFTILLPGLIHDVIFDGGFRALRIRPCGIHRRRFQVQNDDRRNRQQKLEDLGACAQIRFHKDATDANDYPSFIAKTDLVYWALPRAEKGS